MRWHTYLVILLVAFAAVALAQEDEEPVDAADEAVTDDGEDEDSEKSEEPEVVTLDGLSATEMEDLRSKADNHEFEAEVSRLMNIIINSLYKNKEIFVRELISNSADALDKIRILSLTDKTALDASEELSIRIKIDKDSKMLHITDTGIGMTREELVRNLGTIAKSGTSDFMEKLTEAATSPDGASDLIGQFGVGFYSAFLGADSVIVTSKHNNDSQHIWESDANNFKVAKDPRGDTLLRGTTVSLRMKDEATDFLEEYKLKDIIKKYSQFINFPIYLWTKKTEEVDVPIEEEEKTDDDTDAEKSEDETVDEKAEDETSEDDDVLVEEEKEEEKPKTKKETRTTWDWEQLNDNKPVWTRKPSNVTDEEYTGFYKAISKDWDAPLSWIHFTAEGEVTFKCILYIPKRAPPELYNRYGQKSENVKLYVRRVFITDDFQEMIPKYLMFVRGVVDSDDLPLNVGRETLQQHKLLTVIRKKLTRKVLDMIKKLDDDKYKKFYEEYSTALKLGVIEDPGNRNRLAKLLRFQSSGGPEANLTTLTEYVERMKPKQEAILYVAASSRKEAEESPFVERYVKRGFEVLYLVEPVDEYVMQNLPDYDGKKFQNLAKEGKAVAEGDKAKQHFDALQEKFEPLTKWMEEVALKDKVEAVQISQRLADTPSVVIAKSFAWSGNMQRVMSSQAYAKAGDSTRNFYANQKKTLEINPYHPIVRELLERVKDNEEDDTAATTAELLLEMATLRSGFDLSNPVAFAERMQKVIRKSLDISEEEEVEVPEDFDEEEEVKPEGTEEDMPEDATEAPPVEVDLPEVNLPEAEEEDMHVEL